MMLHEIKCIASAMNALTMGITTSHIQTTKGGKRRRRWTSVNLLRSLANIIACIVLIKYWTFDLAACESTPPCAVERCSGERLNDHSNLVIRSPSDYCLSGHWIIDSSNRSTASPAKDACDCNLVCAHQSGQSCRSQHSQASTVDDRNDHHHLCDLSLNLQCNTQTDRCEGPLSVSVSRMPHQFYYVNWLESKSSATPSLLNNTSAKPLIFISRYTSPRISQLNFTPLKAYITRGVPNKLSAKVEAPLEANTTYMIKVTDGGQRFELAIFRTDENGLSSEALPKVLVTHRNCSSISIAFDDFKPPNYSLGYAIKYRHALPSSASDAHRQAAQLSTWTTVSPANNTPFYVLSGLSPNTRYLIQVFTWNTTGDGVGSQSETVNVTTLDGCWHARSNRTYAVGDIVLSDCEQTCTCAAGGVLDCVDRCISPFVSIVQISPKSTISGQLSADCKPHASDECCVRCSASSSSNLAPPGSTNTTVMIREKILPSVSTQPTFTTPITAITKKFIDKPGNCSNDISDQRNDANNKSGIVCGVISAAKHECSHDYHCTGVKKCCANACGQLLCELPAANLSQSGTATSITSNDLCPFKCGANAKCLLATNNDDEDGHQESTHRCVCIDGFHSDEPINGCYPKDKNPNGDASQSTTRPSRHRCLFEAQTFEIGQSFEHACQTCQCSEALEIECTSKCDELYNDTSVAGLPSGCRLIADVKDPKCCQKMSCESVSLAKLANSDRAPNGHHHASANRSLVFAPLSPGDAGCKHLDSHYRTNQTFYIDCELKCQCKHDRTIKCVPRCFPDPGYDSRFCRLIDDPDDPECCKISICDHDRHQGNFERNQSTTLATVSSTPAFIIEMAEAIDSTSLKLRLHNIPVPIDRFNASIYFWRVRANESFNTNDDEREDPSPSGEWNVTTPQKLLILSNTSAELVMTQLEPETDYLIKVKHEATNVTTNTVFVRTYPIGINHTFNGCFHGRRVIEVGEQYFEGECEYRCVCREGGIRECEERCPVYLDLIGYEACRWEPSTEDPCCTVPVCSDVITGTADDQAIVGQQSPTLTPHCIAHDGKRFQVGDTWRTGSGCGQKTCHCLLDLVKRNTSATPSIAIIKCDGGCPEIPSSVIEPNELCGSPKVIQPKDACVCPYVVCDNNFNPLDLPEKASSAVTSASRKGNSTSSSSGGYCEFRGDRIAIGKEFYDNCRAICRCSEPGPALQCKPIQCSRTTFGPHTTKCLDWDIDANFVPLPPNCCPEPKCKNDGSCSYAGIRFGNFKHIPSEFLPCGKRCVCHNGHINCENVCPEVPDEPPHGLPCPPGLAFRGYLPGDKCCIHWQCRDIYQKRIKSSCVYKDKRYKLNEHWDETETEIKRRCQCKMTNGILHVACNPGNCQPITERYLEPTQECSVPNVVVPRDPIMCPYVVCNHTKVEGGELSNVDMVAINATSARIRFSIPSLYIGLLGHAEVHYTTDMNAPPHQWNIQKFARPKRMFDIANIEYHLGGLRPDTTYFLQIEVVIEALKSGPSSEIFKLYQPPLPVTTSTTSTTTTSTLPPIIMLDMQLSSTVDRDSNSVKLVWRSFSSQEKRYIDGVQVRYKKDDGSDRDWIYSPMLHRSTTEYVLHSLEPASTYIVDLMFASTDGISTSFVSTKPVLVTVTRDNLRQFEPTIYPDDVSINDAAQIDIHIRDLPRPVTKYVSVVKLCYQQIDHTDDLKEQTTLFDYVNIDESGKVSFVHLLSNTRYKIWIDFYLSNGQIVSSNAVEIITKFKQRSLEDNDTGALSSSGGAGHAINDLIESKYLLAFMIMSVGIFVSGVAFLVTTCIFMRKHSTAAISRTGTISEAAYDNPTYKTFEVSEKCVVNDIDSMAPTIHIK